MMQGYGGMVHGCTGMAADLVQMDVQVYVHAAGRSQTAVICSIACGTVSGSAAETQVTCDAADPCICWFLDIRSLQIKNI